MDHLIKCRCHLIRKVGSLMLGSGHYCAIPVSPDSLGTIYSGTYNGKLLTSCCSRRLEISRPGQITSAILPFSVRLLGTLINIERTGKRELSGGISSLCWEVLLWSCLGHGIMVQKYHNHLPVAGGIIFTGIFHFWFPSSSCVCADKPELSEPPVTAEGKKIPIWQLYHPLGYSVTDVYVPTHVCDTLLFQRASWNSSKRNLKFC